MNTYQWFWRGYRQRCAGDEAKYNHCCILLGGHLFGCTCNSSARRGWLFVDLAVLWRRTKAFKALWIDGPFWSSCAVIMAEPGAGFDSQGLGLRAQKKLLGKMSSKTIAKAFIDDTTGRVLDNTYRILKEQTGNKKDAEKIMKYIIKTVVKVGILHKNDQFNAEELKMVSTFKQKFNSLIMTVISFWEVDFTYDQKFLTTSVDDCRSLLQSIIARHLTDKTKGRVDLVFNSFVDPEFLNAVFGRQSNFEPHMNAVVQDLHKLIEEGNL